MGTSKTSIPDTNMMIVGVTGGIGSGKSRVMDFFAAKGAPCFSADQAGHQVLEHNPAVVHAVKAIFGDDLYNDQNQLNRKRLAAMVFSDTAKLKLLNGIVHPAVAIAFEAFVSTHASAPLVFKEAAILFEWGAAKHCDKTVLITAPLSVRIERVQQRDNSPEEAIIARIALQWPDEKKITLADFVLENQHWDITLVQLEKIYQSLLIQANATD